MPDGAGAYSEELGGRPSYWQSSGNVRRQSLVVLDTRLFAWCHIAVRLESLTYGGDMAEATRKTGGTGKRLAFLVAYAAAVIASLLTFPAGIPWMVALWLVVFCVCLFRGWSPVWPMATCAAILIAKGTTPDPGLLFLLLPLGVAIQVAFVRRFRPHRSMRYATFPGVIVGWICWLSFYFSWERPPPSASLGLESGSPIVCLGDSLTLNEERTGGYPEELQKLLDRTVINLGQPGITTAEALPKLVQLKPLRPGIVIIELGGHDFLKGKPRAEAKNNLELIIAAAREAGAEIILFEIPRGFIHDPWWGLERQIAREQQIRLIPDGVIRSFVLYSPFAPPGMWTGGPYLSDDGLHPNKNGNQVMAEAVARAMMKDKR